ncbi:hypothetical protein FOMG_19821 [Fusarium oxysporum f. sp. melonis 26406]|uniref:HAT C-terminal dimerisation domain-containing protein n=1 Tax=Fusarium oxysporum f. sp. melonis 26406 TaxID=1089452 RepID=W9YUZ8_FUSOX|nr:hypothetical protein FOMG_19821 [Fusarium oxysporum f. sp. melonis 26406]
MDVLHKHYQQAFNKYKMNQQLLGPVLASWHVFDKYYQLSDESPAYAAALILHPSRGKAHIQKNWPKAWHKKIFTGVKKLWEDEYKNLPTIYTTPSIVPALELDEYDLLAQELNVIGTEPDVDEYETYTSQPPIMGGDQFNSINFALAWRCVDSLLSIWPVELNHRICKLNWWR